MSEEFVYRVMRAFDENYGADKDDLSWRTDTTYAPVTFLINCNDLFCWACADCERLTPENIGLLEQSLADCLAIDKVIGGCHAASLFCARVRKERPQGACYDHIDPQFWPLFDACGPAREAGLGNPRKHPSERGSAS